MSRPRAPDDLPQILWLWLPLDLLAFQLLLELLLPATTLAPLMSENGPHEILQAAVLLCGLGVALDALARPSTRRRPEAFAWIALAALCQVYVAGEELSWGQHLFGWTTPDPWSAMNDQDETNLHNTSDWLDQKPRALLMIGVLVGGSGRPARHGALADPYSSNAANLHAYQAIHATGRDCSRGSPLRRAARRHGLRDIRENQRGQRTCDVRIRLPLYDFAARKT